MEKNIFEELRERKQRVLSLADKATQYGWITKEEAQQLRKKIEEDVLTIGVIGQMKCGKSTVLNAIVFEDDVLPSATTPMTAALSVITYGEEKKLKAEFYTPDEWNEQKMHAERPLSEVEGNTLEESKVKAAKELVEKSVKLGSSINDFLGKTKEDTLDQLVEYVGADGKYVSITKSVTIYYPKDYLKGVEIVDTPGFNDPIVSREERTKTFLKKADVILLMLYAGRPFDATDRDILFKNVRQCGIGKVLVGINKYDIPYHNGESEDEIKDYVKSEIEKACRDCDDATLVEILRGTEPIPLSAEMALLSEMPMSKINSSEIYREAWKRHCDDFEISSQPQMMEKSHLDKLVAAIREVIDKEKVEILLRKPLSVIINAGMKKKADLTEQINLCKKFVSDASLPDDEFEERRGHLAKANRRINRKIDSLGDEIDSELATLVRRGKETLEDDIDGACKKMDNIVDNMGLFQEANEIAAKLDSEVRRLVERTLKRDTEEIGKNAKRSIEKCVTDFIGEVEEVMLRFVKDFDTKDFITSLKHDISFTIKNNDVFTFNEGGAEGTEGWLDTILGVFDGILDGATLGIWGKVTAAFSHKDTQMAFHKGIDEMRSTDVSEYVDSIMDNKPRIINEVKKKVIDEMLTPIQQQLDEIVANKDKKEQQLTEAKAKLDKLEADEAVVEKQLAEFK